jgi:hypothetical protein
VTTDDQARHETVFREGWRGRQTEGARPGELIKQPKWIDAGLLVLGGLLAAGTVAAATITVPRTETLSAMVQGESVTAARTATAPVPAPGSAVQYRDATTGTTSDAVVVDVTATEVIARLERPGPASAGQLLIPAGRQRLISLMLPRLW